MIVIVVVILTVGCGIKLFKGTTVSMKTSSEMVLHFDNIEMLASNESV